MRAYQLTGLYRVSFSQAGSFAKFQAALGYEPDHVWTEDERRIFVSGFTDFKNAFEKLGGQELPITVADAMLVWLKVYDFGELGRKTAAELLKSLSAVWPDVKALTDAVPIAVSTQPPDPPEDEGLLGRFFRRRTLEHLNVAFINEFFPEQSDWVRAHDLGRQYLETVMGDSVTAQVYNGVQTEAAETAIDEAVCNGAQVIFATTPSLINACRKAAAKYAQVQIMNCSVAMPYTGVWTYYSRIYEGKFITGAVAGAMSSDGQIGYVASNPIFGVPAGINAFAMGALMTNPRTRIRLHWSCVKEDAMEILAHEGLRLISNRDLPTPDRIREPWGLCQVQENGHFISLVAPYWHWGSVYVKLVRSILNGGWKVLGAHNAGRAVNYWWGMDSRAVDVLLNDSLPAGLKQLVDILRQGLMDGSISPFQRPIRSQDGVLRSDGTHWFSPEEILHMDWLCDCIDGEIPAFEEILPISQSLVRLQGVYRDAIPPEKEGTIL